MENYIPLLNLYSEKNLHPVCDYNISVWFFHSRYDYVEAISLKEKEYRYYYLVRKGQFGILRYKKTFFGHKAKVIIPCRYDEIEKITDNNFNRKFKAVLDGQVFYFDETGKRMP